MREMLCSIRVLFLFTLGAGIVFPMIVTMLAQALFPFQAGGSLLRSASGELIGSELIGQRFESKKFFHPRRSFAGTGYDAASSGGSNLGPTSAKLIQGVADDPSTNEIDESFLGIHDAVEEYRRENALEESVQVPADAVTFSASGLDPEISPRNAELQAQRVSNARGIPRSEVERLIQQSTRERFLGIFGEPGVNVLRLNLLLEARERERLRGSED